MFQNGKILYFAYKYIKMKKIASILLFGLLIWGCKKPITFEYRGIKNLEIGNLAGDSATLKATISFFNPNKYAVQLKKIDADIYANENLLSHYNFDTTIVIPGNSAFDFPATIKFSRSKILDNIAAVLFQREITLRIKGNSKVGRSGFFVNVPFDFTSKQSLKF